MPPNRNIENLIEPHVLRPTKPLPSRLIQTDDGERSVPLEPGKHVGPVTVYPVHRRRASRSSYISD